MSWHVTEYSTHLWGLSSGRKQFNGTRPLMVAPPAVSAEDEATAKLSVTLHPPATLRWDKPRPTTRGRTHQSSVHQQALLSSILQVPLILRHKHIWCDLNSGSVATETDWSQLTSWQVFLKQTKFLYDSTLKLKQLNCSVLAEIKAECKDFRTDSVGSNWISGRNTSRLIQVEITFEL